jgi:hypothetical protein
MSTSDDLAKSEMLRRSMRCFVLGWWSLVPVLGVVPAMLAFADFRAVVLRKGSQWNAAVVRLVVGACLAGIGLMLSLGIGTILTIVILKSLAGSS